MSDLWYIATKAFGPATPERWQSYMSFSGLSQLTEVVSLDSSLCPPLLPAPETTTDWDFVVNADFMLHYYVDLDYLDRRLAGRAEAYNLLGVLREPGREVAALAVAEGLSFEGYDLIEAATGISALTNCGGFPQAFANSELSPVGLLTSWARAAEVQRELRRCYPEEPHAHCDMWAIWRRRRGI